MKISLKSSNGFAPIIIILLIGVAIVSYLYFQGNLSNLGLNKGTKIESLGQVDISENGFIPATIKVTKGTQITWTNKDKIPHKVASDPHPTHTNLEGFESDVLNSTDAYSFVFEKSGTYTYHDHL